MKISDLTVAQAHQYFASRITGLKDTVQQMARCPFHEDSTASLSVNVEKKVWSCKAGCGSGGILDFEEKFSVCDRETAWSNVLEAIGVENTQSFFRQQPEAVYRYTDELRAVLYEKLRYPGKRFVIRRPDGKGGWVQNLPNDVRKVLYNLPALISANQVLLPEGEKDCDNLSALNLNNLDPRGFSRVAATTNFDGAGKWKPGYGPYFAGKFVAILPDNDEPGERHALTVANSVYPYAASVRIVRLPGLPPKGDVSDYLQTHTCEDLIAEIKRTPLWHPEPSALLVSAIDFLAHRREDIEWLVDGVIQKGASGFIVSDPKVGKSWMAVDLAISLALGTPWLDFHTEQCRVALISREDNPALTQWRMNKLLLGKGRTAEDLGPNLYVNSKDQSPQFKLDNAQQLTEMMTALRAVRPAFVILDVLNVLHSQDENDNTEMRVVLDYADLMQRELRASVCILHHFNKAAKGRLTERMRGAGAMAGFAEWIIGIEFKSEKPDEKIRYMDFDLKAASPHERLFYTIWSDDEQQYLGSRLERVKPEQVTRRRLN